MRLITLPAGSIVEVGGERLVTTRDGVWPEVNVPAQPARSDATAPRDAAPLDEAARAFLSALEAEAEHEPKAT